MILEEQALSGVWIVKPRVYEDRRGWFRETYREELFRAQGIHDRFVQTNHSHSAHRVLRGLHYQLNHPQARLCRVVYGEVMDVVVDIRVGSPTFGRSQTALLSAHNGHQVYVPPGFAHGFVVLSESADFLYGCSDYYHGDDDYGVAWNDPTLGIDWGIDIPVLSEKDGALPLFEDIPAENLPQYDAGLANTSS